jgi:predicted nucleic acid-binding protein
VEAVSTPGGPVLVDTSVWTRIATRPEVTAAISARLAAGQKLCTCPLVDLELLHSARGPAEYDQWATTRAQAYPSLPLTPAAGERALQVQRQLAHLGLHRAAKLPDLLIAAIAETAGATVLHYDSDYDHINAVTGQPTEWIVTRGSID